MEIKGKIIMILPLASGISKSGNEWRKQEYILETTDTQYPRKICFNLWGDRIDQFPMAEGDHVIVHIDLQSREYNGRWYTDVSAWRIDPVVEDAPGMPAPGYGSPVDNYATPPAADQYKTAPTVNPTETLQDPTAQDDLPF